MTIRVARSAEQWINEVPRQWAAERGVARAQTTITVGNFDGVHLGHQAILRAVTKEAEETASLAVVVTFDPHPLRVLRPEAAPQMLETLEQRILRFEVMGIEGVLVLRFDEKLAALPAEDFVDQIVAKTMAARTICVGDGFRFGHRQAGNVELLRALGKQKQFQVRCVPPVILCGSVVSSSAIRQALGAGEVRRAAQMLGRGFALAGEIVTGAGLGRKSVVPTLNLATPQELLPANGVYATECLLDATSHHAVTNVGLRPTFGGKRITIESHLLDYAGEPKGRALEVRFCERIRDERKFGGPGELRAQILQDIEQAREFLSDRHSVTPLNASTIGKRPGGATD
jgi:riboflavin kinase / FMN adenylyltransferase